MELKIEFVAKSSRPFEDYFTRGVNCGGKWYNVEDSIESNINSLFRDDLLARGNIIEADVVENGNRSIIKNIKLVKKSEPRQSFKGNYRKTEITKEEAFGTMEECVKKANEISNKYIVTPSSEDIRTLANTLFIRITDK